MLSPNMKSFKCSSNSSKKTKRIAQKLGECLHAPLTLALDGDLGSGKTIFVTGLAQGLKNGKNIRVQSPTFALARSYPTEPTLHHIDLYRINDAVILDDLGIESLIFDPLALVCIEWPGQYPGVLPSNTLWIFIKSQQKNQREIEFQFDVTIFDWTTILKKLI
jgi:tRNA threonylcarbamoyladenosine biosynthesis protein TsaE